MSTNGDRTGLAETNDYVGTLVASVLPRWVVARAIGVSVSTDRAVYEPGEPVEIVVSLNNRLPLPISVRTPRQRLWGWRVDGRLSARDEAVYTRPVERSHAFRPGETKRIERTWDGRFVTDGPDGTKWTTAAPGEHEIEAFVAIEPEVRSATTIRVRRP